ncbi:MAG TPA: MaoC/PaaZ C-terminal domain-containing protein [Anaeromyxobacteraceae bacterium]|nr:MaoC/PaaZ C-terminal domain-containing protein [Anaeromyxobacteraceae bacterium]
MALLARQLYFEAVKVGDELPPLVKPPVDRVQIARYAGASFDFNPLSVDEHHARNSGFPAPHVPATLVMGFLAELAVDWLRGARIRRFSARFVKIVFPGDVLTCRGRVVDRRFEPNGVYTVDIEVWAENQRGELATRGLVTAQLYYSAEDETRQRGGQPALVVTPEQEAAALAKLSRAQAPKKAEPPPPPPPPPRAKAPPPPKPPPPAPAAKAPAPFKPVLAPPPRVERRPAPVAAKPIATPTPAKPVPAKPVASLAAAKPVPAKVAPAKPITAPKAAPARPKPMAARRPPHKVGKVRSDAPQKAITKVRDAVRKLKAAVRPAPKSKQTATRSSRQRPGSKPNPKKRR